MQPPVLAPFPSPPEGGSFLEHNWTHPVQSGYCDSMPWDNYTPPPARVVMPPGAPDGSGFGNKLFVVALAILSATRKQQPLLVPPAYKYLSPCFRSSRGLEQYLQAQFQCEALWSKDCRLKEQLRTAKLLATYHSDFHQDLKTWGRPLPGAEVFRKAFMPSVPRDFAALPKPGRWDLVMHFRAMAEDWNWPWAFRPRLAQPPAAFFRKALAAHRSMVKQRGKVWVVTGNPTHPTAQRILQECEGELLPAVKTQHGRHPMTDFAWLMMARHLVLSPSSFGWWAAFIGAAEEIHFPIFPAVQPMEWCKLAAVEDTRFVFHDWFGGGSWRGGEEGGEAMRMCRHYEALCMKKAPMCPASNLSSLAAFYEETARKGNS